MRFDSLNVRFVQISTAGMGVGDRRIAALFFVLLLISLGCSSVASDGAITETNTEVSMTDPAGTSEPTGSEASSAAQAVNTKDGAADSPMASTFRDFLGVYDALETAEVVERAKLVEIEESKVACMAQLGFEYLNNARAIHASGSAGSQVDQFGFGITTNPGPAAARTVELRNPEYLESLSDGEYASYIDSLVDCENQANEASRLDPANPLIREIELFMEEVLASEAVRELDAVWSDCMANNGFTGFANAGQAQREFLERVQLIAPGWPYPPGSDRFEETVALPSFAELQREEVILAVSIQDCNADRSADMNTVIDVAVDEFLEREGPRIALQMAEGSSG